MLHFGGDIQQLVVEEVKGRSSHRDVGFRLLRLFLDRARSAARFELDDAVMLAARLPRSQTRSRPSGERTLSTVFTAGRA
jgi:hypothetical protein